MGEQPLKSFLSLRSMVRLSIGEALTNLLFGNITRYSDIHLVLSFNCAGKLPGETARMYECCKEVKEAMNELNLEIVNVKDSVSMAVHTEEETVMVGCILNHSSQAPLTLVVTAFANTDDVNGLVTPDIKHAVLNSRIVFIDLHTKQNNALGGSALAQVLDQLGEEAPEVDLKLLQRSFYTIQNLMKQRHIISGHDRSDGGLITALLEMCFAGDCGIDVTLPEDVDPIPYLFNESLGWLLEVDELLCEPLLRTFRDNQIPACVLGITKTDRTIQVSKVEGTDGQIKQGNSVILNAPTLKLRNEWERTSYELEKLTYNRDYIEQVVICIVYHDRNNVFARP